MPELRRELLMQAARAERLAGLATDEGVMHTLRDAARDYRFEADRRLSDIFSPVAQ